MDDDDAAGAVEFSGRPEEELELEELLPPTCAAASDADDVDDELATR